MFGANRANDRFWEQTLENLARSLGVATPVVETQKVCVDRRRQWQYAGNAAAQRGREHGRRHGDGARPAGSGGAGPRG